jgi:hypothetical protein
MNRAHFNRRSSLPRLLLLGFAAALASGCAGYQIGARSLYRPDVRTVHVPIFESESLRRNLGERLTEAVVKRIESESPYKVVPACNADSVLSGRILSEQKRVAAENANDAPRDLTTDLWVEVSWVDHRGELLAQPANIPLPPLILHLGQNASFVPEAGQSLATAQQETIERLAKQIVQQMETPW